MPIRSKSIWQQISNPRETYTDGYGTQREVYEPAYVTKGRDVYNKGRDVYQTVRGWFNPGENLQLIDPETGETYNVGASGGSGVIEMLNPAGLVGRIDDAAALAKNLEKAKQAWAGLAKEKGIYGFNPSTGTWSKITKRAAQMQEGNSAKYSLYASVGGESLQSKIASRKAGLVERGDNYVIRENTFANPKDWDSKEFWRKLNEKYSGPDSWANSGTGSQVVRGHENGGNI